MLEWTALCRQLNYVSGKEEYAMCKRMKLKRIIKNDFEVFSCVDEYYYPGIPDPVKVKIMKYFDPNLNPDYVVAFYDDSIFKRRNSGYVFTLTGIYFRYIMGDEVYYFNYKDITSMRVIPYDGGKLDEMATLEIRLANGSGYAMKGGMYLKDGMKALLQRLKDEVSQWDDIVSTKPSGEYKRSVNPFERWGQERLEGVRKGYEMASAEYEEKLRRQADEFLKQIRNYRKEIDAYEQLLDEYERYIYKLEAKQNNKNAQKIKMMKNQYNELRHLKY